MSKPDPNKPIVDPEEIRRHDEEFAKANPDWDKKHGNKR